MPAHFVSSIQEDSSTVTGATNSIQCNSIPEETVDGFPVSNSVTLKWESIEVLTNEAVHPGENT